MRDQTPPVGERCPSCGARSLLHEQVRTKTLQRIDVFACEQCGDWWFSREGERLSIDALDGLGLAQ